MPRIDQMHQVGGGRSDGGNQWHPCFRFPRQYRRLTIDPFVAQPALSCSDHTIGLFAGNAPRVLTHHAELASNAGNGQIGVVGRGN